MSMIIPEQIDINQNIDKDKILSHFIHMAVTIKDIAKKANISVSTVSKALNNRSDVSDQVKRDIKILAKEMGYKKNIMASRLVNRKSNTLGVFIYSKNNIKEESETTAFKYIKTLLNETKKSGYDLILFSIDSNTSEEQSYIDLCTERQVEGAIFIGFESGDKQLEEIINSDLPVVLIERYAVGQHVSSITFDNFYGMNLALNYLLSLNHKRIAFIKGKTTPISEGRTSIFREFMSDRDLYSEDLIYNGDYTLESGYKIGCEIVNSKMLPTAVFSSSDLMAVGLIRAFDDYGIKVPEDISIIGYDDFEICKYVKPRLTTVAQDFYAMASKSTEVLLDMINNKTSNIQIIIKPELIIRDSCRSINL